MNFLATSKTKIASLVLAFTMLLPVALTGCNTTDTKELDWTVTDESAVISFDLAMQGDDTNRTLVLTYDEDVFNESISDNQFKISGCMLSFGSSEDSADESSESATEDAIYEITGWSVKRDSAKQLTFTLPSGEDSAYSAYTVAIHTSATINNAYGEAWAFKATEETIENVFASIEGTYNTAQENPTIVVVLNDTSVKTDVTKEMITLEGAFSGLTIKSVSAGNNRLTILTEGKATNDVLGGVTIAAGASEYGEELSATTTVVFVGVYVDESTYKFENGSLNFDIALAGDEFTVKADDKLITTPFELTVVSVSEDKATVTVKTAVTAAGLDEAIFKVSGQAVTIPGTAIGSGSEQNLSVTATKATVGMDISHVEETDDPLSFKATATVYAANGTLVGLDVSSLKLTGDFDSGTVVEVKQGETVYSVIFTFSPKSLDLENAIYEGTVAVKDGTLKNVWGTSSDGSTASIIYVGVANMGKND